MLALRIIHCHKQLKPPDQGFPQTQDLTTKNRYKAGTSTNKQNPYEASVLISSSTRAKLLRV